MDGVGPGVDLSEDMRELLRGVPAQLVEVTPLQGSAYAGYQPSSFRLRFADGRLLKGRQCGNWQRAAAIEYVLRHVHDPGLPALVGRVGRAVLTEWVDGRPLTAEDCTPSILRECGALLSFLHGVQVPEAGLRDRRAAMADWHALYESDLFTLVRLGALEESEARYAVAYATQQAPSQCSLGFVHRDFCPENLVLRPSGAVAVVDNETVGVDACEYDLGRTWYRWPMAGEERALFLAGYARHRSPEEFVRHENYWTLVAMANAAVFRWEKSPAAADVPLAGLRALLRELENKAGRVAAAPKRPPADRSRGGR